MDVGALALPSGCVVKEPLGRALAFCREEYIYYDGVPSSQPNRIEPVDVLVTVSMNSFVNSATKVRSVHRGLAAACDTLLSAIPADADLLSFNSELVALQSLLDAACRVRGVLLPVATKVLHRKRRSLIPMLDNVLLDYYFTATNRTQLLSRAQDGRQAAGIAVEALKDFRRDLTAEQATIDRVRRGLEQEGFDLSNVRILELLIWTEVEPQGYYRQ